MTIETTNPNESTDPRPFQTVARIGDLKDGEGRPVQLADRDIALFRDGDRYFAIDDACPHKGIPLSDGIVHQGTVTCTWHGWMMSLESGCYLANPRIRVTTYPVRVEGDEIQIQVPA